MATPPTPPSSDPDGSGSGGPRPRPWFGPGRRGRGLQPVSPAGWAVTAGFVALVGLFAAIFRPFTEGGDSLIFAALCGLAVVGYVVIANRHSGR